MKRTLLTLGLLSCMACSSAHAWDFKPFDGWNKTDKVLYGTGLVFQTIDLLQTNYIYSHSEYHEINPVIDTVVDMAGTKALPLYFLSTALLKYAVADMLEGSYRTTWLATTTAISVGLVYHNNSIGLGLDFTF